MPAQPSRPQAHSSHLLSRYPPVRLVSVPDANASSVYVWVNGPMVDIHSHVLPDLDDGSRSVEESLEMLRIAAEAGTTDIVATPHASPQFPFDAVRVRKTFQQLSEECRGVINLHLGCDFHLTFDNVRNCLENPGLYTVNSRSYLMVELPD